MFIKDVLKEELENSTKLKLQYEQALAKLPKGSLIKKNIKGHDYYYCVYRVGKKIHLKYRGKSVSEDELKKYTEAKNKRVIFRRQLSEVNSQIRYLRGVLRERKSGGIMPRSPKAPA